MTPEKGEDFALLTSSEASGAHTSEGNSQSFPEGSPLGPALLLSDPSCSGSSEGTAKVRLRQPCTS